MGSKFYDENLKLVLMPDKFFIINFYVEVLFIVHIGKVNIFSLFWSSLYCVSLKVDRKKEPLIYVPVKLP